MIREIWRSSKRGWRRLMILPFDDSYQIERTTTKTREQSTPRRRSRRLVLRAYTNSWVTGWHGRAREGVTTRSMISFTGDDDMIHLHLSFHSPITMNSQAN
jgi:hypothetical protein